MKTHIRASRWGRGLAVGGLLSAALIAAGCDEFLTATNPGLIQETRLGDTSLVDLMANSAVGALQDVYSWMADYGSMYSDETRNHASFFEEGLYDQRRLQPDNGTLSTLANQDQTPAARKQTARSRSLRSPRSRYTTPT